MTQRRLLLAIGTVAGLIGIAAWIGELDLGLDDALSSPSEQHGQSAPES
jgi:hypothetical protein